MSRFFTLARLDGYRVVVEEGEEEKMGSLLLAVDGGQALEVT